MSDTDSNYSLPPLRRQLHRVAFEGEDSAHWALFLPTRPAGPTGILCHVGVAIDSSGCKTDHQLRWDSFDISKSSAKSYFAIPGAIVTENQLRRTAETVFDRKGYRSLTNNCQHFCIDVLIELNRNWPDSVTAQAVAEVQARGTKFTKMTTFLKRTRVKPHQSGDRPPSISSGSQQERPRFSID